MPVVAPQATPLAPHEGRLLTPQEVVADALGVLHLCAMKCTACGFKVFPPSDTCPSCLATQLTRLPLGELGTLYSYTTVHIAPPGWQTPYVLGYVDFPEGVRVFGKVKVDSAATLQPDMKVAMRIIETEVPGKGTPAYRYYFTPASA